MMNDVQPDSTTSDLTSPQPSVGAALRAARESLGLTTQEIADRTKFSVRQVEALEQDDAAHLPQGTFLRGFIRSYARVVHLEPEKLLNGIEIQPEHHSDVAEIQSGGDALPAAGAVEGKNLYLLIGVLIIALGLAFFLLGHRGDGVQAINDYSNTPSAPAITPAITPAASAPAVMPIENSVDDKAVQPPAENQKVEKIIHPAIILPVQKEEVPSVQKEAVPAVEAAGVAPVKREVPLEQLMKRPIHIMFQEDAWVEVADVNGEILISRVTAAGGEKWIGGKRRAPYRVTLGKASAVRLYYKGKEIDLSLYKADGRVSLILE